MGETTGFANRDGGHLSHWGKEMRYSIELEVDEWGEIQLNGLRCAEGHVAAPGSRRLAVKRDGRSITRSVPKPVVIVDTREQAAYSFERFDNWIADVKRRKVAAGDYSVEGMESLLAVERKSLADLIRTTIHERARFFRQCAKMAKLRWKAILVEASYEDVKSYYDDDLQTEAHPNAVSGTLDAVEAKFGIPVIYSSRNTALAEEKLASWLSKHFTYWHLEEKGLGRVLQDQDGL